MKRYNLIILSIILITLLLIFSCSSQEKMLDDELKLLEDNIDKISKEEKQMSIIFAGTTEEECTKGSMDDCDLYIAEIELNSGEVFSVEKIIGEEHIGEVFPAYDINKKFILYERNEGKNKDIYYYIFDNEESGLLIENGQNAILSEDGKLLGYWIKKGDDFNSYITYISFNNNEISLTNTEELPFDKIKEPIIFPDNNLVALYFSDEEKQGGQNKIYNLETEELFEFSNDGDGCTHGSVSPSEENYFCQTGNTWKFRTLSDNEWSDITTIVPDMSIYSQCQRTSVGHPEFCTDDYLISIVSCFEGNEIIENGLGLYDLEGNLIHWLQDSFEDIADITNSRTATCR